MEFYRAEPTPVTSWRMAVLMGANSRTYKFALATALLELARQGRDIASMSELAVPYALALAQRAEKFPQAPESAVRGPSDFLSILKDEADATRGTGIPTERLVTAAATSMPAMVMQKFHNLRGIGEVNHSFYRLRGTGPHSEIELTPNLMAVAQHQAILSEELGARWSIVEASFDAGIGRSLIEAGVVLSDDGGQLISWRRRVPVTKARSALVGFQHGRCFYCHEPVSTEPRAAHVDHVYPYALMKTGAWNSGPDLNYVWNLVVACGVCNLTKSSRIPTADEVAALIARNERIIQSPHPLRRTLELTMRAVGEPPATSVQARLAFLRHVHQLATDRGLTAR